MLRTARLTLEPVAREHAPAQLAYYRRNAGHLNPWEPAWPSDFLTLAYWEAAAARAQDDARSGVAYRFAVLAVADPSKIIGSVNLSHVIRGVYSAAQLGYSIDEHQQGTGIGTEAVGAVVDFAFGTLRLHRVMANYQPGNERSGRLLRRLGFVSEGYARDYLFIDGAWRDHVLTAKHNPDGDIASAGPMR